jgi:predicted 2-oxoglutarate/Fe(II)-dependent dioxygenase YbiX
MSSCVYIDSFIDEEQITFILDRISQADFTSVGNNKDLFSLDLFNTELFNDTECIEILLSIQRKIEKKIELIYNKPITHSAGPSVLKYEINQKIGLHRDWEPEDSYVIENKKKKVDLASIVYFNEDYNGGDLVFYKKENLSIPYLTLKPSKGSCIIFDSDIYHDTISISSGTKYCQTTFYSL